jgi:vesicle coat complex subunit
MINSLSSDQMSFTDQAESWREIQKLHNSLVSNNLDARKRSAKRVVALMRSGEPVETDDLELLKMRARRL